MTRGLYAFAFLHDPAFGHVQLGDQLSRGCAVVVGDLLPGGQHPFQRPPLPDQLPRPPVSAVAAGAGRYQIPDASQPGYGLGAATVPRLDGGGR